MKLAAFLIGKRPVHPEHAEHHARHRVIRIGAEMVKELVIVVRVSRIFRWRLRAAMWFMRLAGHLGGFKQIRLVRDNEPHESR